MPVIQFKGSTSLQPVTQWREFEPQCVGANEAASRVAMATASLMNQTRCKFVVHLCWS